MKKFPLQSTFRWLLATWMLVATSVMSSTYVHSHNGGNLAHHHDGHDRPLSQHAVSTALHDSCEGNFILSAGDTHQHGCLVLLGTITYQSMPDKSSDSQAKHPYGWETIVTASTAQNARVLARSLTADYSGLGSLVVLSTGCVCESKPIGYSCARIAPASSLCDRARHERSGVLLA